MKTLQFVSKCIKILYDQISQYFTNTIRNLPADEINEIDRDLQRNNYFVNLGNTNAFSDHNILDTFCNFFENHGRFPGSQELIIAPRPEIPNFIKTQKIISINELYQKLSSADARGLFAIQAITVLNIYFGGRLEISKQAFAEFLHNMSHQALNKDNDLIFMQFDRTADLINELIFMLLDRNTTSVNVTNVINDDIINELNNYQSTFDVPTETKIQDEMFDILQNKIKPPAPPPAYSPPPLLTTNEIKAARERINAEFLKKSLLLNKDQLDASNEAADQKNKKIIKDIIDPTPGLFIDNKLNANDQIFKNTIDNVFNLLPQVQQLFNNTVFKKTKTEPIFETTTQEHILNIPEQTVRKMVDFFIDDDEFDEYKKPETICIKQPSTDHQ